MGDAPALKKPKKASNIDKLSSPRADTQVAAEGLQPESELASAREDMRVVAEALSRLGFLGAGDMDASCLYQDGCAGCVWPGTSSIPLAEFPQAHRAVFSKLPKARAVMGVSLKAVKAVACLENGVRALTQDGAVFFETVAVCNTIEEAPQALDAMPAATVLMVRGEGMYVFGTSIPAAFVLVVNLQLTCRVQLAIGSHSVVPPDPSVLAKTRDEVLGHPYFGLGAMEWPAVTCWVHDRDMPLKDGQRHCEEGSEEQKLREALSLAHKSVASKRADLLVWNHMSSKFSEGILITPGDRMWHQMHPETIKFGSHNITADILHSAVYTTTAMTAVVHLHTVAVQAVACLSEGFIPPKGSQFVDRVAYHPWEGFSDDPDECQRVSAAISNVPECRTLILSHHGAITFGFSVQEALERYWELDAACRQQLSNKPVQKFTIEELCD